MDFDLLFKCIDEQVEHYKKANSDIEKIRRYNIILGIKIAIAHSTDANVNKYYKQVEDILSGL